MSTQTQTLRTRHKLAVYAVIFVVALAVALPAGLFVAVKMIPAPQQPVAEVVPSAVPTALATTEPTPATPTATPTPQPTPTPSPTPTPTATPENKPGQPGTCLVLEQQYCGTGDLVIRGTAIGLNIPPGTPIFAPFDGTKVTGTKKKGNYQTVFVLVYSDGKIALAVDMWPIVDVSTGSTVKKGEVVAKASSVVVSEAGSYNLVVSPSVGSLTAPEVETFIKPFSKSLLRR